MSFVIKYLINKKINLFFFDSKIFTKIIQLLIIISFIGIINKKYSIFTLLYFLINYLAKYN